MEKRRPKVCIPTSPGGHLTQVTYVLEAFHTCDVFYISNRFPRTESLSKCYFVPNWKFNLLAALWCFLKTAWVLIRERPDYVFSTGAEPAIAAFYLGKILGAKTIFMETVIRTELPTLTGKLVYPVTDEFLVQHESMLVHYPGRARFRGAVV